MKRIHPLLITLLAILLWPAAAAPTPDVKTLDEAWIDAARDDRKVPVRIYYPATDEADKATATTHPVILFSHGLGGSREGYVFLGEHWAAHGYVSVHLQHLGSDDAVWRGKARIMKEMRKAAADVTVAVNRPLDVTFAINELTKLNKTADWPLAGRLNLEAIGVAGHSFGAFTTLAAAGQTFVIPGASKNRQLNDPRIKAAIPMSSPVAAKRKHYDEAFASITIPCLHMTGTEDKSPIGKTTVEDRRVPFDQSINAPRWLVIFKDGDHMIFSDHKRLGRDKTRATLDAVFHDLIQRSTTTFWDAWLRDDKDALAWLNGDAFGTMLGEHASLERAAPVAE